MIVSRQTHPTNLRYGDIELAQMIGHFHMMYILCGAAIAALKADSNISSLAAAGPSNLAKSAAQSTSKTRPVSHTS
jgi:hypothetical protein